MKMTQSVATIDTASQAVVAEFEEEDPLESLMKHVRDKEAKESQENEDELEYPLTAFFCFAWRGDAL